MMRRRLGRVLVFCAIVTAVASCATASQRPDGAAPRRVPPAEDWRNQRPPAGPAPTVALPSFAQAKLKNGLTVLVAQESALP
ncbi:MAG: insulinase family protein, partial [Myxococcota bacterium]